VIDTIRSILHLWSNELILSFLFSISYHNIGTWFREALNLFLSCIGSILHSSFVDEENYSHSYYIEDRID